MQALGGCTCKPQRRRTSMAGDAEQQQTGTHSVKDRYLAVFGKAKCLREREILDFDCSAFESAAHELVVPFSSYNCITQAPSPGHGPPKPDELWVGDGGIIPLWWKGDTVNWVCQSEGWPTRNHALYAAKKLLEAANSWNAAGVGVTFKLVESVADAEFMLTYGGAQGGVVARAFFPNTNDLNPLYVYARGYDADVVSFLTNVFQHELGHVLGLRHEFADREGGAILFGGRDPMSIMRYEPFPMTMSTADRDNTRMLYDFQDNNWQGWPIVRRHPDN